MRPTAGHQHGKDKGSYWFNNHLLLSPHHADGGGVHEALVTAQTANSLPAILPIANRISSRVDRCPIF